MPTEVVAIDPLHPDPGLIARAAWVLRAGGLLAFPTETVYGLGANALDAQAIDHLYQVKGRPAHNPIIVHIAEVAEVLRIATTWPESAARLAERFWPGPLTLVLPKQAVVPDVVTGGGNTVAVRLPAHPVARALIQAAQIPVAAPSANRSSALSPTRAEHVLRGLGDRLDMILDGGPTPGGIESTVVDVTCDPPRLLRPGLVSLAELEAVLGPIRSGPSATPGESAPLPSPGMLSRHYAPRTPLECLEGQGRERVEALNQAGLRVAWVPIGSPAGPVSEGIFVAPLPQAPVACASQLYALLHILDEQGFDRIVVDLPEATVEWQAVRDRLLRAAA